jgi:hypothetical protein
MRRFFLGLVLAAAAGACVPSIALAGDFETATGVAQGLRTGGMQHYSVGVVCKGGTATLKGTVASDEQRALAIQIAEQSQGVGRVIDQMQVGAIKPKAAIQQTNMIQPGNQQIAQQAASRGPNRAQAIPTGIGPSNIAPGGAQQTGFNAGCASCGPYGGGGYGGGYAGGPVGGALHGAYDQPHLPRHAWPAYAAYPNYGAVTYPKQYSPTAWPYIGPFYPYPQVPLGWRKVTLEWDDGWWMLDFKARRH